MLHKRWCSSSTSCTGSGRKPPEHLPGYVRIMVRRQVYDRLRRTQATLRATLDESDANLWEVPDPSAEQAFSNLIVNDQLHSLLEALPTRQRQVVSLLAQGYGVAEVAERLNMSVVTVRSNVRHARAQLRELVSRNEFE